jgi:hypothetical protein
MSRSINSPDMALYVVLLLRTASKAVPLDRADASLMPGNTKTDIYEPEQFLENHRTTPNSQWQGNWGKMPEFVNNCLARFYPRQKQCDQTVK